MGRPGFASLLAAAILAPALMAGQEAEPRRDGGFAQRAAAAREQMESFERHLEQAVAEVSMSHAGILLGRMNASRGYRLPGYGIIFVLSPRALPGDDAVHVFGAHPGEGRGHPGPHREVEVLMRGEMGEIEALERQVLLLQHAAETRRRAAQEDHERIVRSLRVRLGPASEDETGEEEAEPGEELLPAGGPLLPPPPPWRFWFDTEVPGEARSPEQIVGDVREAVITVLEARGAGVVGLERDDLVTVAVDFVPGAFFAAHPRPTRTLIVRARRGDLAAHARGGMASEEFRARVEVIEY